MEWDNTFMILLKDAVARYHEQPNAPAASFFLPAECDFLAEIGYTPAEMYGYVRDYATMGDPSPSTILLIAATRRCFFITSQRGIFGNARPVTEADLPSEDEDFQEIRYLPRIMRKAEAKLHGTLSSDLMYYCAKDREFLRSHGDIHPADFLHLTWAAHGDRQRMITAVINAMNAAHKKNPAKQMPAMPKAVQSELQLD